MTKLSAITELTVAPASTDELYLNDNGTEKRITVGNLFSGKQTVWIPADLMQPTVTAGCATHATVELTAGQPNLRVLDFDASSDEHAGFSYCFPKRWDLGTITYQVFWTSAGSVTTGITMGLQGVFVPDDSTIDAAFGTAALIIDNATTTANELYVSPESAALTIGGTPADDGTCFFRLYRDVSGGNDDMTQDARVIGIKLFYTADVGTDD